MSQDTPMIVAPDGRPARKTKDDRCPRCRAGKDKRCPSSGFGQPIPVCIVCGYEFLGEECE
jgi:uncharacterized protein (DUF983 family)